MSRPIIKQRCVIIAGTNGSGKTSDVLKFVKQSEQAGRFARIFNPTDETKFNVFPNTEKLVNKKTTQYNTQFLGKRESMGDFLQRFLEDAYDNLRNGLLVIDDASSVVGYQKHETLNNILVRRRQMNVDILLVFHGLNKVPGYCMDYATHVYLKKQTGIPMSALRKIPDAVLSQIETVNKICSKPETQYYGKLIQL